jgi:hypothetical protein
MMTPLDWNVILAILLLPSGRLFMQDSEGNSHTSEMPVRRTTSSNMTPKPIMRVEPDQTTTTLALTEAFRLTVSLSPECLQT